MMIRCMDQFSDTRIRLDIERPGHEFRTRASHQHHAEDQELLRPRMSRNRVANTVMDAEIITCFFILYYR